MRGANEGDHCEMAALNSPRAVAFLAWRGRLFQSLTVRGKSDYPVWASAGSSAGVHGKVFLALPSSVDRGGKKRWVYSNKTSLDLTLI